MGVWYASREDVKSALDSKETARNNAQIDRALEDGSRDVEKLCHRVFHPVTATRYRTWPSPKHGLPWKLWLEVDELISLDTLTSGGTTIVADDYFLEPDTGPPFTAIELDRSSGAVFGGGATPQRDITLIGEFGYQHATAPAGALAEALDASETAVDVTNSAAIGVGNLITVEDERMIVTEKSMLSTAQTLQADLTAAVNDVTVAVMTGGAYHVGEVILLDSERMLIVDISGNNLTVKRAWDGSVLAAHSGSTIFAPRTLTVERGATGTTAATHADATSIARYVPPGPVRSLTIAEALNTVLQETAGYARQVGSGDSARNASGAGLATKRKRVYDGYGRKARTRAV